jgi:hypothetical protein
LFGLRDGNYKAIYNAVLNRSEIYDLAKDPQETTNLAPQMPDFVETTRHRLAAWVQYQNRQMRGLLREEAR